MRGRSSTNKSVWACNPCAFLLLSAVVPRYAAALFQGSGIRDTVHKVFKVKITEDNVRFIWAADDPRMKGKRAGSMCPTGYDLCAATLGGNCCPEHYACAKDYCYATTAATSTSTCQGNTGYYACAETLGGGCCAQGLLCATNGQCTPPAGATYSTTCPTGYALCPSSVGGGCCMSGMGCAVSSCYSMSPSTTTITYTTTEDGSAVVVTTTSATTPATPTSDSTSSVGDGAVPKLYPSTHSKALATATSSSSSSGGGGGGGGLSKAEIGGIIAGVIVLLIAVLTSAFFIIKRLKRTERVVQSVRETTSGTRTRRTTDKKSEVSQVVRVRPTPSEVDQMDYDPLMMTNNNSTLGRSTGGAGPRRFSNNNNNSNRARGDSDAASQRPSLWSGPSAGMRWNTPSVDSDPGGDPNGNGHGVREYFELPPRTHSHNNVRPTTATTNNTADGRPQMPMRASMDSASQYSYRNYIYGRHGRHESNASELSAGSDEYNGSGGSQQPRLGSPSMLPGGGTTTTTTTSTTTTPHELGIEGEFRPELPGSDTETESNSNNGYHGGSSSRPSRKQPPRRRSTAGLVVSPMSTTTAAMTAHRPPPPPPPPPPTNGAASSRRRGNSLTSHVEEETVGNSGEQQQQQQQQRRALGSIDESSVSNTATTTGTTDSLHGHFGRPMITSTGPMSDLAGLDMAGAPLGLGLNLGGGLTEEEDAKSERDSSESKGSQSTS